jgi:hypothetical protein
MKKINVHAEIMYQEQDGSNVHSYICPPECNFKNIDADYREFLHKCLDEWLDNSNGTGMFYIKKEEVFETEME